jgi:hypothetical protein
MFKIKNTNRGGIIIFRGANQQRLGSKLAVEFRSALTERQFARLQQQGWLILIRLPREFAEACSDG